MANLGWKDCLSFLMESFHRKINTKMNVAMIQKHLLSKNEAQYRKGKNEKSGTFPFLDNEEEKSEPH